MFDKETLLIFSFIYGVKVYFNFLNQTYDETAQNYKKYKCLKNMYSSFEIHKVAFNNRFGFVRPTLLGSAHRLDGLAFDRFVSQLRANLALPDNF